MTTGDFIVEAVLVTLAKALAVFCPVAAVAIIGAAFWRGRRVNGVWPDRNSEVSPCRSIVRPTTGPADQGRPAGVYGGERAAATRSSRSIR